MYTLSHTSRRQVNIYQFTEGANGFANTREGWMQQEGLAEKTNLIDTIGDRIAQILETDPTIEKNIQGILRNDLLGTIIKNPLLAQKLLDTMSTVFDKKVNELSGIERNNAIHNYTVLIEQVGHGLARSTLNIPWDNELRDARYAFETKYKSLTDTYKNLLATFQEQVTNQA